MKTWIHVERRLERMRLPYRVQDETLVSLDGTPVAVTVQGARDLLSSPGHPDSKRQQRRRHRDLTRHGARALNASCVLSCPPVSINKRRELRNMRIRLQVEDLNTAYRLTRRLMGEVVRPIPSDKLPIPVDAIALMAQIHQMAQDATGVSYAG